MISFIGFYPVFIGLLTVNQQKSLQKHKEMAYL